MSGIRRPSCSQTSNATVFFAWSASGFVAVLRLYQPNRAQAASQRRYARSYGPSTRKTVAPNDRMKLTFAGETVRAETKMYACKPIAAAPTAREHATLPLDAHAIDVAPLL